MRYLQQGVDECRQTQVSSAAPEKRSSLGNNINNLPVMDVKDILSQGPRAFMSPGSFRHDH